MKSILKGLGVIVAVAVALVVGVIVIVTLLIDPNDYKDEISDKVKDQTGRQLKIEGDILLTYFPWLGFQMGSVELGNAPGFQAPVFASTEKVAIRLKLFPLLQRKVVMDTLEIHGLHLNLEKNAKGATNWDDLIKGGSESGQPAEPGKAPQLAAFAIGGLDIQNANISWSDAQAGQQYTVRNFSLETGALNPGKPVDVSVGLDVQSTEPPMSGRIEGAGQLEMNPDTQLFRAIGFNMVAGFQGEQIPGGKMELSLFTDAVLDGKQQSFRVNSLKLNTLGVEADLTLSGQLTTEGPKFSGTLQVPDFNPRTMLENLGQSEIETADSSVLANASLEAKISGTDNSLAVTPITMKLDDSNLKGEVLVQNFANPAIGFSFGLDQMDADRYLPPPKEGKPAVAATPGAAASSAAGLPMETLRSLNVVGKLAAAKFKVAKLNVSDFNASITAKNGLIQVNPLSAKLYEGVYAGNIQLDARGDKPKISLNEKLTGIQAGPLLKDLQGEEKLTGKGDVSIQISAIGTEPDSVKRTLNGNAAFKLLDGAVKGVNIGRMIRESRAKLKGQTLPPSDEPEQTDFAELTGTVTFTNGLAKNQDLLAKSPLLRITGAGQADLPSETIDYRVQAKIVGTSKGQGGKELTELSGVTIPIKVSGTFAQPKYALDAEALGKGLAESKVKEIIQEKIGGSATQGGTGSSAGEVKEKAKELLKGILGN
ncbi:MAG: AsmA family protein [Gammaproteobacteria bacterium]|nr:AsmA family protein [Gammaproteobacteria bacterium]MDH3411341.1 AsmA family protein [Gammaproteobacteria bacterium]